MTDGNHIPPAGLHPRLVKKLLDNLESNNAFRTAFAESPEKALRSIGYTDPWTCMTLKAGAKLASLRCWHIESRSISAQRPGAGSVCQNTL